MIGKAVCVTGGSGYIASWLIKLLLRHGYTVIASVRDPCLQKTKTQFSPLFFHLRFRFGTVGDLKKTAHLLELDGAEERLHLYRADLLEEGSFDSAVRGCVGVFHTASPVSFDVADPQVEVVDPAVNGTLNVLKSCAKSPSVKRVIVTSSIASMFYTGKPSTEDTVADETWFSDPAVCRDLQVWYQLSKTLAESAAWEFAKENNIDLVTINPGFVNGPFLQPTPTFSAEMVLNLVNAGNATYPSYYYWSVDVRDVAEAHVKAFETESAHGRYCLVGSNADFPQVLQIIHQLYPTIDLPNKCEENDSVTKVATFKASQKKAEEGLGMKFIPLEVSLRDTIECFKAKGFLHF
ncbi:Phenylacetaldehyde reductase [Linum perenne]